MPIDPTAETSRRNPFEQWDRQRGNWMFRYGRPMKKTLGEVRKFVDEAVRQRAHVNKLDEYASALEEEYEAEKDRATNIAMTVGIVSGAVGTVFTLLVSGRLQNQDHRLQILIVVIASVVTVVAVMTSLAFQIAKSTIEYGKKTVDIVNEARKELGRIHNTVTVKPHGPEMSDVERQAAASAAVRRAKSHPPVEERKQEYEKKHLHNIRVDPVSDVPGDPPPDDEGKKGGESGGQSSGK